MTTILYDAANFMTDNEYQTLARTTSTTNVQSIVEKPQLYILGRSASKDIDQISYTEARIEDLKQLTNKIRYGDIDLIFKLRLFSGDGPARQFEAGQQKGETSAVFVVLKHDKISEDTVDLIQVLVEIINIAYSSEEKRSPRQILRLYNLTFLFGVLTKSVIGTPVKITTRKLYGCHFHSLVVHLPEVYRIVNTKSILCEQEERSFEAYGELLKLQQIGNQVGL
ncbi:unnamed protein product [Mytilus coruscus]|uniref:Uncharacterized protein n=1 Tax=Mytilus coruscus TaxID=42192 RepID=A0A6J8D6W3_MYTCO|nr:unnamed protein product [Mytilus coruscus]